MPGMGRTAIDAAFAAAPRENFLPPAVRGQAGLDAPLPIGYGQTNSQPYTVRLMLGWLDARPGDKVLDVGSGSGWTTALLARLVGPKGKVYAVEKVPQLARFGSENCAKLGLKNVAFYQAGDELGLPAQAPYDRILVSASAAELPAELLAQLKPGGKMVVPVKNTICEITAAPSGHRFVNHPGFAFVPLVK
jgi:protein-L-isoaspartate(D-aspartate) O-methyltransferase